MLGLHSAPCAEMGQGVCSQCEAVYSGFLGLWQAFWMPGAEPALAQEAQTGIGSEK